MLVSFLPCLAQAQIESVVRLTAHPAQYERVDFAALLTAEWATSPYRTREVCLDFNLVAPSGAAVVVPAYYDKGGSGTLSLWKVRFTPVEAGVYTGVLTLTNGNRCASSSNLSLAVAPTPHKGFLRASGAWTFRFDNGDLFRGIGENIAWESRSRDDSRFFRTLHESPRYNYEYLLGSLAANGGNFFRTWMCPWNLPLEWKQVANTNRYSNDGGGFNGSAMERMDQMMALAESLDLYVMLTLDNSGDFQGRSWRDSSYNLANGGPVAAPQEFFTDPQAKAQFKDRLRYLVARWGYSPHLAAWEFFNEIDNLMYGLPQRIPDTVITAWHAEMSAYLKSIDPYHHLVTTSISHRDVVGLNQVASLDFTQRHIYGHDGHSQTDSFPQVLRRESLQEGKPFVIGEFGFEWDWSRNFDDDAAGMDGDFKKGLWLGLFSPTPVLPMSWWWEYFDHRGVTPYIGRVRSILDRMLAAGGGSFADVQARWIGQPATLLAVRCGQTFFALALNDGSAPAAGAISLPLDVSRGYQACVYDPASGATETLPSLQPGLGTVSGISIQPGTQRIVILSPLRGW
jgi:hypothetical protein